MRTREHYVGGCTQRNQCDEETPSTMNSTAHKRQQLDSITGSPFLNVFPQNAYQLSNAVYIGNIQYTPRNIQWLHSSLSPIINFIS